MAILQRNKAGIIERIMTPVDLARERRRQPGEVTILELADQMGLSYSTVYRDVTEKRKVPFRREGYTIFLSAEDAATYKAMPRRKAGQRVWRMP